MSDNNQKDTTHSDKPSDKPSDKSSDKSSDQRKVGDRREGEDRREYSEVVDFERRHKDSRRSESR